MTERLVPASMARVTFLRCFINAINNPMQTDYFKAEITVRHEGKDYRFTCMASERNKKPLVQQYQRDYEYECLNKLVSEHRPKDKNDKEGWDKIADMRLRYHRGERSFLNCKPIAVGTVTVNNLNDNGEVYYTQEQE